ncbi:MAG: DNA polymerase III subunit chi [Alphaproteobacteria bacterium]|nr:DNA polymerase III subunit chi [Alphaproteobacteria bacterium]
MKRIDFYHLQKNTLEEALPKLVQKAYETGKKIKIKVGNELRLDFINTALWTFDEESFLPHGVKKEGNAELQPIYLSSDDENVNDAVMLFLVDGATVEAQRSENFERIFYVFNGASEDELSKAREMWKAFKADDIERHYWQQDDLGKWKEKQL